MWRVMHEIPFVFHSIKTTISSTHDKQEKQIISVKICYKNINLQEDPSILLGLSCGG